MTATKSSAIMPKVRFGRYEGHREAQPAGHQRDDDPAEILPIVDDVPGGAHLDQSAARDAERAFHARQVRIPTKAATYSNLIAATIPI
jgi:hypothetical protein